MHSCMKLWSMRGILLINGERAICELVLEFATRVYLSTRWWIRITLDQRVISQPLSRPSLLLGSATRLRSSPPWPTIPQAPLLLRTVLHCCWNVSQVYRFRLLYHTNILFLFTIPCISAATVNSASHPTSNAIPLLAHPKSKNQ
jgi:hypothetical protein